MSSTVDSESTAILEQSTATHIQRDLAIALADVLTVESAMSVCVDAGLRLTGLEMGAAYLADPDTGDFRLVHATGLSLEIQASVAIVEADSPPVKALLRGQPIFGFRDELGYADETNLLMAGIQYIAVLPIRHGSRIIGSILLAANRQADLSNDCRDAVEGLVAQLGGALTRIRLLQALRESERRYRSTLLASPDSILLCNLDGTILLCSGGTLKLHGFKNEQEVIGQNLSSLVTAEDSPCIAEAVLRMQELGHYTLRNLRVVRRDGSIRQCTAATNLIRDAEGRPTGFVAVTHDRTEEIILNRERETLWKYVFRITSSRSLEELTDAIEEATQALLPWDAFVFAVRRSGRIWFLPVKYVDTIEGRKKDVSPPLTAEKYEVLGNVLNGEPLLINREDASRTIPLRRFGDTNRGSECLMFAPVRSENKVAAIISVQSYTPHQYSDKDLDTLQRLADAVGPALECWRAEKHSSAFASLGRRLSAVNTPEEAALCIAEVSQDLIGWDACSLVFVDPNTGFLSTVSRMDTIRGKRVLVPAKPNTPYPPGRLLTSVVRGEAKLVLRSKRRRGDDGLVLFGAKRLSRSMIFVPVRTADRVIGIVSAQSYKQEAYTLDDLEILQSLADHCAGALERTRAQAARTELEVELLHSQKLTSLGQLAGRIAHDFNNVLHVIMGFSELAVQSVPEDCDARDHIEQVKATVQRGTALTRDLLAFGRKQQIHPVALSVNDVIAGMERLLGQLLGRGIDLEISQEPSPGKALADASQLEMVLMNLAVNARDAMPLGGKLSISTGNAEVGGSMETPSPPRTVPPGQYVTISVADTGHGIPTEILPRIFDPFFTTKPTSKGTGLGLSSVYGIITQLGGHILVSSVEKQGTIFTIYLPRIEAKSEKNRKHRKETPDEELHD